MNLFSKYLHICSWVISIPPINNSLKVHSSLEAGAGLFTPSCLECPGQVKALNYCKDPYITSSLKAKWQVPQGKAFLGKVAGWEACSSPLQVRRRDSLLPFCCAWQTHTGPRSACVMGWKRSAYALQESDLARRTLTEVPWEHSVSLLNRQGRKRLRGDCSPLKLEELSQDGGSWLQRRQQQRLDSEVKSQLSHWPTSYPQTKKHSIHGPLFFLYIIFTGFLIITTNWYLEFWMPG